MAQHGICLVEVAYLIAVLKVKSGDMLAEAQERLLRGHLS
jgi:hypothetical protein